MSDCSLLLMILLTSFSELCKYFADPNEDQFEKRIKAKKERVAKNEFQRLRNLARNKAGKSQCLNLFAFIF